MSLATCIIALLCCVPGCAPKFACEDSVNLDDPRCHSVSNMYHIKMRGKADPQKPQEEDSGEKAQSPPPVQERAADMGVALVQGSAYEVKVPVRVPPKVIRIWIAPWEDADGDLHQPGYIFSEINDKRGRWVFGERQVSGSAALLTPVDAPEEEGQPDPTAGKQTGAVQDRQGKDAARGAAQAERKALAEERKYEKQQAGQQKESKTTADKWRPPANDPTLKLPSVKK